MPDRPAFLASDSPWIKLLVRPQALIVGGFAGAILIGAILLLLPFSHRGGVTPLAALFTATSAVCVTGLTVVDTGTTFTAMGHTVILVLIQLGGLGIMSFGTLLFLATRRRLSLRTQAAVADSLFQQDVAREFRRSLFEIFCATFLLEAAGAVIIYGGLLDRLPAAEARFAAVFHAVSAFCNAGLSTFSGNLEGWRSTPRVVVTIAILIVLGGLGYPVLIELRRRCTALIRRKRPPRVHLTVNTQLVLTTSAALTAGGAILILLAGTGSGLHEADAALFQSVTARTAGFNTVPIGAMPLATILILVGLMAVGGSPGSCAGGVKTTTFATALAWVWTHLRGRQDVAFAGRRLPESTLARAGLVIAIFALWNSLGVLFLSWTEAPVALHEILFEQVSAFCTVGLTCGITPKLSAAGQLWIIATMFFGRLGTLTIAVWMFEHARASYRYPQGHVMIG
jgi:trk system potassium uptake protein TrkH